MKAKRRIKHKRSSDTNNNANGHHVTKEKKVTESQRFEGRRKFGFLAGGQPLARLAWALTFYIGSWARARFPSRTPGTSALRIQRRNASKTKLHTVLWERFTLRCKYTAFQQIAPPFIDYTSNAYSRIDKKREGQALLVYTPPSFLPCATIRCREKQGFTCKLARSQFVIFYCAHLLPL